jgi:hypothetical protein
VSQAFHDAQSREQPYITPVPVDERNIVEHYVDAKARRSCVRLAFILPITANALKGE